MRTERKYRRNIESLDKWSRTMANTKILIFAGDIKCLQRTKIIRTERKYRRTQNHWISGLEYGKYQNIYIY